MTIDFKSESEHLLTISPKRDWHQLQDFYTDTLRHELANGNADQAYGVAYVLLGEEIERRYEQAQLECSRLPEPYRIDLPQTGLMKLIDATLRGARTNVAWPWGVLTSAARALLPGTITVLSGMGGASKSLFIS